ncbi:MAG: hypothetical protein K0R09_157 [Clostridiales bacterium]|jgi:hypothetical protein|nr:hypothetical protein [Clostridiales bacterium]
MMQGEPKFIVPLGEHCSPLQVSFFFWGCAGVEFYIYYKKIFVENKFIIIDKVGYNIRNLGTIYTYVVDVSILYIWNMINYKFNKKSR